MYNLKKYYWKYSTALILFLNPIKVFAEEGVDALQGGVNTVESTTTVTQEIVGTPEGGKEILRKIQDAVPDATESDVLKQINKAVNHEREGSWALAIEIAKPIGWVLMLGANILWYLTTFLYSWQTALDVISLISSNPEARMGGQQGAMQGGMGGMQGQSQQTSGGGIVGWLAGFARSFFAVSWDFKQTLMEAGLGGSTGGGNYGGGNYGGGQGNNTQVNNYNNGSSGNNAPRRGNLLRIYIGKRWWTLVWLGFTIAIFASSLATDMQADMVSWLLALLKGFWNFLGSFFKPRG